MATAPPEAPLRVLNDSIKSLRDRRAALVRDVESLDEQIDRYQRAKKLLEPGRAKPKRRRSGSNGHQALDPAKVAGPKAIRTTKETMEGLGRAPQAQVTKETGLNSGSVSYALRALAKEGIVEETGEMEGRSKVWKYVGPASTKVAPGT